MAEAELYNYGLELLAFENTQVAILEELSKNMTKEKLQINLSKTWKKIRVLHTVTLLRCFLLFWFPIQIMISPRDI